MDDKAWYPSASVVTELSRRLEQLEESWHASYVTQSFFRQASEAIAKLPEAAPQDPYLVRDWVWVASQLRVHSDDDLIGPLAWSGLFLVEDVLSEVQDPAQRSGALRWLRDQVVERITEILGPGSVNNFISKAEREKVEDLLLDLAEADQSDVTEIIAHAMKVAEEFSSIHNSAYFPGISEKLTSLADAAGENTPSGRWARAALSYLRLEDDVVADTYGYLGLLDDIQVIEDVYEIVTGTRSWAPLVQAVRSRLPALSQIYWTDGGRTNYLQPYMQAVVGCALQDASGSGIERHVVVPELGPIPFLAAVLSAVGEVSSDSPWIPSPGDGVRFMERKIARYGVIRDPFDPDHGDQTLSIQLRDARVTLRSELLPFLEPVKVGDNDLATPKQFYRWAESIPQKMGISVKRFRRSETQRPVIFLTERKKYFYYRDNILPLGHVVDELVPVTYRSRQGRPGSATSGDAMLPGLIVCSSMHAVETYLEECSEGAKPWPKVIFIDKEVDPISLESLRHQRRQCCDDAKLVIFSASGDRRVIDEIMGNFRTWFLRPEDVDGGVELDGHFGRFPVGIGPIAKFMRRRMRYRKMDVEIHPMDFPELEEFANCAQTIRKLAVERQDGSLEAIVIRAEAALREISRCAPLPGVLRESEVLRRLDGIEKLCSLTGLFDEPALDMQAASELLKESLERDDPPKIDFFCELLKKNGEDLQVIVGSRLMVQRLTAMAEEGIVPACRWISIHDLGEVSEPDTLIVPGWFGTKGMCTIQSAGWSNRQLLVLYGYERRRLLALNRRRAKVESELIKHTRESWSSLRSAWPEVGGVPHLGEPRLLPETRMPAERETNANNEELDEISLESWVADAVRKHVEIDNEGAPQGDRIVQARLLLFGDGERYGLFADGSRLICLNDLIDEQVDAERLSDQALEHLLRRTVEQVQVGDILAFPDDPDYGDIIDVIADQLINDNGRTRRESDCWRSAVAYLSELFSGNIHRLQNALKQAGVKREAQTVRMWLSSNSHVAPQAPQESVPRILECAKQHGWEVKVEPKSVVSAIDKVYQARRAAGRVLVAHFSDAEIDVEAGIAAVDVSGNTVMYRILGVSGIDPSCPVPASQLGLRSLL